MIVPIIIPIRAYPYLVKRSELDQVLKKEEKGAKIGFTVMIIGSLLVQLIMVLFVLPRLVNLYSTYERSVPSYTVPSLLGLLIVGLGLLVYVLTSYALDKGRVEKIKLGQDELISIPGPLRANKLLFLSVFYVLVSMLIMLGVVVYPIYSLTTNL